MMRKFLSLFLAVCSAAAFASSTGHNDSIILSNTFTSSFSSADIVQNSFNCGHIIVNVTSISGVSVTPHIQGKDQVTGNYYDILVGDPIVSTGMTVLKVCAAAKPERGLVANDMLTQN